MQQWKTLSKKTILSHNRFLTVEQHQIQLPDGKVISDWPWIISPDFVNVMAMSDDGLFHVFRQVKYAIDGTSLAPVGGHIEPGEDPFTAAQRELREEMGFDAREWIPLGTFRNNGNYGAGTAHLYFARGVKHVAEPIVDDLEEMEMRTLTLPQLENAVRNGEFKAIAWATCAALTLLHLKGPQK
ncbi:MAG: NUDIX hydrolase [Ignavibacteriales bacterium]|nr:NUDIX hydrolase [Ignavibacteriales bacterium]